MGYFVSGSRFAAAVVLGSLWWGASPAHAQSKVEAGTLTCQGGSGVGLLLGSKKTYVCTFSANGGRTRERYGATITKIGIDIGVTGESVIVWTVLSAGSSVRPGMLAGNYAGAAADASIGVGGGAKLLVGGSKNSITLQPLSIQGQTGVNLAVGVAGLTLR